MSLDGTLSFKWQVHVVYWILIILFWPLLSYLTEGEIWEPFINKMGYLPSQMIVTYVFLYILLPWFFNKRYVLSAIGLIVLTYVTAVLARIMKIYFYEPMIGYDDPQEGLIEILTQQDALLGQYVIWVYMTPVLTIIIVLIYTHFNQQRALAHLEAQRAQSELSFLKAQLHPHFLFNTLNNLYTLSLQGSDMTVDVAMGLKKLLRYMLDKSENALIPLSEELDLVHTYVSLEKLRYGKRLNYKEDIRLENEEYKVVPFVLLSLVENAFKHGASKDPGQPYIQVQLRTNDKRLDFSVENSVVKEKTDDSSGYAQGIGVSNIKRQLAILYPDRHSYKTTHEGESYKVQLSIEEAIPANFKINGSLKKTLPS